MLIALAVAAALQQPGDVYLDDAGCRWKRKPVAAKPLRPAKAASAPLLSRPKANKPAKAKPAAPADEFIGCDPEGFGVWRSDLEAMDLPTISVETFEAVLELVEPPPITTAPPTFAEACECSTTPTYAYPPSYGGSWSGWIGPIPGPIPGPIATPIPELPMWAMMLGGLLVLLTFNRRT